MTVVFDNHPEHRDGDKCMVFLDDGERGGIVMDGYDNDHEAIVNLILHLRAMFKANGQNLEIIAIPNDTGALDG